MKNFLAFVLFALAFLMNVNAKPSRDVDPSYKIGRLYCYTGWMGDQWEGGHIILTNRPMAERRLVIKSDPAGTWYRLRPGTKAIDIWVDSGEKDIRHNDAAFYNANRRAAETCMVKTFPDTRKEKIRRTTVRLMPNGF